MNFDDALKHMQENTYTFPVNLLSDKTKTIEIRSLKTNDQKIVAVEGSNTKNDFGNFTLVLKLLDTCIVKNDVKLSEMLVEDFFWLVIQLLMKSIGEQIDIEAGCKSCKATKQLEKNLVVIDLENDIEINYLKKIKNNVVEISPKLKLILNHINVADMGEVIARTEIDDKERRMILSLAALIKEIEFDGTLIDIENFEQKEKLLGEMSRSQLNIIKKFLDDNRFGITVNKEYKCKNCGTVNFIKFDGFEIIDFF